MKKYWENYLRSCVLMGAMYVGTPAFMRNIYRYNRATNRLVGKNILSEK